jgi:hypothetical protein
MAYVAHRFARALAAPVVAAIVAGVVMGPPRADADIGIASVDRTSGMAGDRVDLLIGCGGCLPRQIRLPISLLPAGHSPSRHPCRGTSCATRAPSPPTSAPYVPLGTAVPLQGGARLADRLGLELPDSIRRHGPAAIRKWVASVNRLRFRIPEVDSGLYTYVIFCCGLSPPAGGDLIGHPQRRPHRNESRLAYALENEQFLRIQAEASSGPRRDGSDEPPWLLWVAIAGLGLLALFAVRWRRSRGPSRSNEA